MQKTIAVTGASGHIGNVVCRTLLEKGFRVRAMYHSDKKSLTGLPLQIMQGDVLNKADLERLLTGCDVVINCAGVVSIHGDPTGIVFKTNTEGPKNVLAVSTACGVKKIIHISSTHAVVELPHRLPFDENRPYKSAADYAYDYSKAMGEKLMLAARGSDPEVVILRPGSIAGPFDFKPSEMGKALLDFYHQKIAVLPPGGYDFVDVRDVANSIVAAIDKAKGGDIFLVTGKYYTLQSLAHCIQKVTGKKMAQKIIPYPLLKLLLPFVALYSRLAKAAPLYTIESIDALRNGHPQMNCSRAIKTLGHCCRPLEETIRDFYSWYFDNNQPHNS